MTFTLLTDEYDALSGAWQSPEVTTNRPLQATTFDAAVEEATLLFLGLARYDVLRNWGSETRITYPRNPRVVAHLEVASMTEG